MKLILASPKAKKRLGQHFITDPGIARKIANTLTHPGISYHIVLEVGPGKGILTGALLEADWQHVSVWASEVDEYWQQMLGRIQPGIRDRLIKESILKLDFHELFNEQPFGLIGNFPYNIASQIVMKSAASSQIVPELAGMFQLEVARRLLASPGSREYGLLSIMFQVFYEGKFCFQLPPGAFSPPPKVHSAVIRGVKRPNAHQRVPFDWLLRIVKRAFQQRRKKLSNTLKPYKSYLEKENPALLDQRPEAVTPFVYERLAWRIGVEEGWEKPQDP